MHKQTTPFVPQGVPPETIDMQFNIERFTAALPSIEPVPIHAPERTRTDTTFDRHLEHARQKPNDRAPRPDADRSSQPTAEQTPPGKPKDRSPDPSAQEPPSKESSGESPTDSATGNSPGHEKSDQSTVDVGEGKSKPAKNDLEPHPTSKEKDAEEEQLLVVAIGLRNEAIVSDRPDPRGAAARAAASTDSKSAPNPSKGGKAVASKSTADAAVTPIDTAVDVSSAAAGPDATVLVAATSPGESSAEAKQPAGGKQAPRDVPANTTTVAATHAVIETNPTAATETKSDTPPTTIDGTKVEKPEASESSEAAPAPRRPRVAKSVEGERRVADETAPQTAGAPANPTEHTTVDSLASTPDMTTRNTVDHTKDQAGDQNVAPNVQANQSSNTSTNSAPTVAPPSPPDKLSSHLAQGASQAGEKGPTSPDVERARFVQRVAKAFHSAAERGGPVRLRLSPPELGSLRLEITVRNGAMAARLEAETPAAKALLLDGLPALRERLALQDLTMERFDVDLMDPSQSGSPQARDGAADSDRRGAAPPPRKRIETTAAAIATLAPPITLGPRDGRLNVLI